MPKDSPRPRWRDKVKQKLGLDGSPTLSNPHTPQAGPSVESTARLGHLNVPSTATLSDVGSMKTQAISTAKPLTEAILNPPTSSSLARPEAQEVLSNTDVIHVEPSPSVLSSIELSHDFKEADQAHLLQRVDSKVLVDNSIINSSTCDTEPPTRDLWAAAVQKLGNDDREILEKLQSKSETRQLVSEKMGDMLMMTKEVQRKCEAQSFKFLFRGKEVIMRDIVGKIAFWLQKFQDVGDVAVSYDPVHAALPWAGVKMLLHIATAENDQMGYLILAIEKLSCLIHRGTVYEKLYHPEIIPADALENFDHTITDLYTTMLRMIGLCHRLFFKSTLKRTVHAMFNPDEISALIQECENREVQVEYEAHNCERVRSQEADTESKKLLEVLRDPILRTDERVLDLLEKVNNDKRLVILDWTSKVLYGANHQTVTDQRTGDTCAWLLDHKNYREWQEESNSTILWLCGTPGTGKTFLTSKVIDEVQITLASKPNQEGFAFFYCNRNEIERREPLSVLRAFVRQLSTTASDKDFIQTEFKNYVERSRQQATQPSMNDCKEFILKFINIYPRTTLVLDALDECESQTRLELIDIFEYLILQAKNPLKIFISSRPDGDIKEKLRNKSNIGINATNNDDDISRFVNSEIVKHRRWARMTPELQAEIVETIQGQSQGMFQWAYLQIKQLLQLQRPIEIKDRLGKLPPDLKTTYDEIYNNITETEKIIADRAFKWVMGARKPLSSNELLHAISQDENSNILVPLDDLDEDLVLEYCHNLLVIDPVQQLWVPSHLSVVEYFEDHLWSRSEVSCFLATVCLLVLQNTVFYNREEDWDQPTLETDHVRDEESGPGDPLTGQSFESLSYYARHHWLLHLQSIEQPTGESPVRSLLEDFLGLPENSSSAYRCWHRMVIRDSTAIFKSSSFWGTGGSHLNRLKPTSNSSFAFCLLAIDHLLPEWHNFSWVKSDTRTETGKSFLELAIISGRLDTCVKLIEHGAEVNAQIGSFYGSALATAASCGDTELVKYLVEVAGVDVNMQLENGNYGSALAAICAEELEMVYFLVEECQADVDMQLQYGEYGNALVATICHDDLTIFEFLLEKTAVDVNIHIKYGRYESALAAAAYRGFVEIVGPLVEKGADVNMQMCRGGFKNALEYAMHYEREDLVKWLVDEGGADANVQKYRDYCCEMAESSVNQSHLDGDEVTQEKSRS